MAEINLGKVKGEDGINVYVRYNSTDSDTGATDVWSIGQNYIGMLTSAAKEKPSTGYTWMRFVGENGTSGSMPAIMQTTGASTTEVMSQKAVTDALNGKVPTDHAVAAATYGVSSASNYGHAMASSATPVVAGTAAVGSETAKFARGDHTHPAQTTITGNAGTATKLATARGLQTSLSSTTAVTFDGTNTSTLNIPITGTLGVGNGGTGLSNPTAGNVLITNGASSFTTRAIGGTINSTNTNIATMASIYNAIGAVLAGSY